MSAELERRIHLALRGLPLPEAPGTLVPRVRRALDGQVSAGWRAVALAATLAVGLLLAMAAPWLAAAAGWGGVAAQAASLAAGVGRAFDAVGLVWQLAAPAVEYAVVMVFVMGAMAAGCGLALGRVTLRAEG
jgi:hypothetical protein